MNFVKLLLGVSAAVQIYYLYEIIYSIPMKKEMPKIKPGNVQIDTFLRGSGKISDNSHETRKQKHQQRPHLTQMNHDNNTALFYTLSTSLVVAYPS